jgi:enoyl-CoA hydratase/carnithine racemase
MGKRYTADKALSSKLVDQICDNSELLNKAIEFGWTIVGQEKLDREQMTDLKSDLYQNVIEDLRISMRVQRESKKQGSKL